jgi:tetratricopeptide (TPR) repeat protein
MKSKYVILASVVMMSVGTFAQKDQLKAAEKALKGGNSQEVITILASADSVMENAIDADKAKYFSIKGNAYLDLANKSIDTDKNLSLAAKAFQDLIAVEKKSGKEKYSAQAVVSVREIKGKLINGAIADSKIDKHSDSAKKLYDAYLLDRNDTINLYYAASTYINAKDYDAALKAYQELNAQKFTGKVTNYFAVNKVNNEEEMFATLAERDRMVKLGSHEKPRNEMIPSKAGEIAKNITLILVQNGKTEEAKLAVKEARKSNPEDVSLIMTEANLYLETKDFETYKKLVSEVLEKNPNDANLVFNLGVLSANAKNSIDAEKYYARAIEIDPKYVNAYINSAALKLEGEKVIIDEMNKLGNSPKDIKRYNELKQKRQNLFKSTIPSLEKALELEPLNNDVAKTLLNVYSCF